ncbi:MAG: NAD(P)/FAD-dependent oxidoreductase, partial [Chitinivibrionales bacterium]|nr:NAD(P)/FAD-dependent oxidoreductase [Chitinivibrionales bacterium]
MNTRKQIAIIGGGPSGMIAAITAARTGCQVTLFERQERIGRKILATGNGRCNLSNTSCGKDNFIGTTNDFVIPALTRFTVEQTLRFFHCLGIHCTVENDGKVFPLCGQASAVLDTLRAELSRLAVRVVVQSPVTALIPQKKGFLVKTAGSATQSPFSAESCIVTAGGKAMPNLGGTDSGLTLLKQLHHRLVPVY